MLFPKKLDRTFSKSFKRQRGSEAIKIFQQSSSKDILECLAKFIVWSYIKKKKDRCTITTLPAARCYMLKVIKFLQPGVPL